MSTKLLFLLLVAVILNPADSLKCYKCTTYTDEHSACEDLSKDTHSVTTEECDDDEVCTVYKTQSTGSIQSMITRACGSKSICDTLHANEETANKIIKECKTCKTDLCSSANSMKNSVFGPLLAIFVIIKLY